MDVEDKDPDGDEAAEVPLVGGIANRGQVVRIGETVRRPQRATSAATHALLRHLADVGFAGAPRFLGIDEHGREVLSYVSGTAITPPYPPWALTDEALASVARLLRGYHDAVSTFDPTPHAWPSSPPPPFAGELVSHNDPKPGQHRLSRGTRRRLDRLRSGQSRLQGLGRGMRGTTVGSAAA